MVLIIRVSYLMSNKLYFLYNIIMNNKIIIIHFQWDALLYGAILSNIMLR